MRIEYRLNISLDACSGLLEDDATLLIILARGTIAAWLCCLVIDIVYGEVCSQSIEQHAVDNPI